MLDLAPFASLVAADQGLCVVTTLRRDKTIQASVVNAGVMAHPVTDAPVVAFVAAGRRKLVHLRSNPTITVVIRSAWQWAAVEGSAELAGPDDPYPGIDEERLRVLLRDVFIAAGGTHDDWHAYDRVMRDERRTAVLVSATRVYTNPS
jgi:PPOX class probable F420-dependent enzyme